jgi:hypothetical protein
MINPSVWSSIAILIAIAPKTSKETITAIVR